MTLKSKYCIVIDNVSSSTPSSDLKYELERSGRVRDMKRDYNDRCVLVEFDR
jgi:hypothetical protein